MDYPLNASNELQSPRLVDSKLQAQTSHVQLLTWVEKSRKTCKPDQVQWCTGTKEELNGFFKKLVDAGTFIKLDQKLRPGCYLARTDQRDLADIDHRTFVCSNNKSDAGPTNNWMEPNEMKKKVDRLFDGCMTGRTMYVLPYCLGPLKSPWSKFGVMATDSLYTVVSLMLIYRSGTKVLDNLKMNENILPTLHSVGMPLFMGQRDVPWPCSPDNVWVALFPDESVPYICSFGSAFGYLAGNATLRLASAFTKAQPKFLPARSSVIAVKSPEGEKKYFCLCMPPGTGQTGAAFETPTIPGWQQTCFGAETAWLNVGTDGRLFAINPYTGFFGIATGNSDFTSRCVMDTIQSNTIFTNCALTLNGDVWWEGLTADPPAEVIDWTGQKWHPDCGRVAAHPNSRYTTSASQCPILDSAWDQAGGVPIEAIVFGVRETTTYPLVFEAFSWKSGIFWGSQLPIEERQAFGTTIPAHNNPLAMGKDSGVHIHHYISNWINIREYLGYSSPKLFIVNWFKQENGKTLWPGFGENTRVFKWIFNRVDGVADAKRTAIGYVPTQRAFDSSGLTVTAPQMARLFEVDKSKFLTLIPKTRAFFESLGSETHPVLTEQLDRTEQTLLLDENQPPTVNQALLEWVDKMRKLCRPDRVYWCTGSEAEYDEMCSQLVKSGTFVPLNSQLRPNSYLARSDPRDVARVESKTFICTPNKDEVGPTNNWADPEEMKKRLNKLFDGCMKGRTMYVIPYCMGPLGSPYSRFGVEVSDSPYVVVNMRIMTRIGNKVLTYLGVQPFLPCLHSVGCPLQPGQEDSKWPCDPDNTIIAHFPDDPSVMSYGSGYGGNALLGKKCYSLRIASVMGRKEGWLAEHMLILGLTSPQGNKYYIVAAFPSACGKTNLAMLVPTLPGWTVRCVGDDIAWLHVATDGTLRAINPENGFFGVAPGTSEASNSSAMRTIKRNTIFTNVALTPNGDVWWEGMSKVVPPELTDWTGQAWTPGCGRLAAHPNSRYTVSAAQSPVIDPDWENPNGVPVSAILFGGRRNSLVPLVLEAFTWQHGVFLGSIISSETTAAAEAKAGTVRRDPFAMLPFCGYNMADYWAHWVDFRKFLGYNSPKIFYVNWFRKNKNGQFLWPGYGENGRVLKWICGRIGRNPTSKSIRTPIGHVPTVDALDVSGLDLSDEDLASLNEVDCAEWLQECKLIKTFYDSFDSRVPKSILQELKDLEARLAIGTEHPPPTNNRKIIEWVESVRKLTKPNRVHWCTGTQEEYDEMCHLLVKSGTFIQLNPKHKPRSFLARSDPRDVARVESKTYICWPNKEDSGPTNNWADPDEMKKRLMALFDGCMKGRTMYIIPFCMGPLGSPYSKFGVEISDSPYVVVNMRIMTRIGIKVLNILDENKFFLPCLHSVGCPLKPGQKDVPWPCDPDNTIIAHFPQEPSVMSFGSGYGGNALLGKKCYSLRIASVLGRKEGWLAEHMLLLSLTSPHGNKYYIAAAFPSACGKTNLAMLVPTLPGWTVRCVGDDIAWLHVGEDGRLYAINPENGFFGVAPGTSALSNSSAMDTFNRNSIFTNVALTPDGDVWWEGQTKVPPKELIDWKGQPWTPESKSPAAHPNSRYTCPAAQSPVIDSEWENPEGVPICAILFGGRRERVIPLVTEAFIWEQGVFMGSIVSSEQTAAAEGQIGAVRRDPFAMLPFCGYNMGDYFNHWIEFRKHLGFLSPKVFYVNWFQKENGKFLWPGFGENCRVLKWICERVDGIGRARATPIGFVPTHDGLDLDGLDIGKETLHKLLSVDTKLWLGEIKGIREYYSQFGSRLPEKLNACLSDLETRLLAASAAPTGNKKLIQWVEECERLLQPANVHWCTGSTEEYNELCDLMIKGGSMIRLNDDLRPNSFLVRTDPADTNRSDDVTFMCTPTKQETGPLNNWADPQEMRARMDKLMQGAMKGRTMYVIAFCMGPLGSPYSRFGVQVTDSPYAVLNMMVQTRTGMPVLNILKDTEYFIPCIHSVGVPLVGDAKDVPWPCNPKEKRKLTFHKPFPTFGFTFRWLSPACSSSLLILNNKILMP